MTFNFNDVTKAYGYNGVQLEKIYGKNNYLLWEMKLLTPSQLSDPFLLMENVQYFEPRNSISGSNYIQTKIYGLTWGGCITPQYVDTSNLFATVEGLGYHGGGGVTTSGSSADRQAGFAICGCNKTGSSKASGIWKFATFDNHSGIYIYSPAFNKVVSKNSPYSPSSWLLTNDIDDGFDVSSYLTADPFDNTTGYTTQELWYYKNTNGSVSSDITENWMYKPIHSVRRPTVIIFADEWNDTIDTYFGWDHGEGNTQWTMYMVKPENLNHLVPSTSSEYTSFVETINDNYSNNVTDGKYRCIVPYQDRVYNCT